MNLLLIQMMVVILTALLCGSIARRLGQARVVGEIIGGILLGPSFFGRIAPHAAASFFPASSFSTFEILSNIGLILFLFLIGSELDYEHIRQQKITATLSSLMSILFPFLAAIVVAHMLRKRFSPNHVAPWPFTLFLGISMSITAFPVLARILEERGMQNSPLGAAALMCAAVDDVCAWFLLAVALTLLPSASSIMPLWHRFAWLALYLFIMMFVLRPLGAWLAKRQSSITLSYELLGVIIAILLSSAAATDAIGIHPLFGAFLAGLCFPRIKSWQHAIRMRLDMLVAVLLLPLFFALTGMRTRLDLLSGNHVWFWTIVVVVVAAAGKIGGAVTAARWTGQTWRDAFALGALLNTRGLVELVVLNIAYNAHIFSPELFTMLVIMALVTTMTTTPLLNLLGIEDRAADAHDFANTRAA